MSTKKAATRRATPVAVKNPLANKGAEILNKYRLYYSGGVFRTDFGEPSLEFYFFFKM